MKNIKVRLEVEFRQERFRKLAGRYFTEADILSLLAGFGVASRIFGGIMTVRRLK